MKLETFNPPTTEVFVEGNGVTVTVNAWHNLEGCNIMVNDQANGLALRMAGAFRWEELDAIMVALQVARTA